MESTIYLGDCIEVMSGLPGSSVDLVVTSPPYNLGIAYDVYEDTLPWSAYYSWCRSWLEGIYRLLKADGRLCLNHYLSCGGSGKKETPLMELNSICKDIGYQHYGLATWNKTHISSPYVRGSYLSAESPFVPCPHEHILIMYKASWKKLGGGLSTIGKKKFLELTTGIWEISPASSSNIHINRSHPATFPETLARNCIELLSYKDDMVMDPFMGVGTTCKVAKELGRRYLGIELSASYYELAKGQLSQGYLF